MCIIYNAQADILNIEKQCICVYSAFKTAVLTVARSLLYIDLFLMWCLFCFLTVSVSKTFYPNLKLLIRKQIIYSQCRVFLIAQRSKCLTYCSLQTTVNVF